MSVLSVLSYRALLSVFSVVVLLQTPKRAISAIDCYKKIPRLLSKVKRGMLVGRVPYGSAVKLTPSIY